MSALKHSLLVMTYKYNVLRAGLTELDERFEEVSTCCRFCVVLCVPFVCSTTILAFSYIVFLCLVAIGFSHMLLSKVFDYKKEAMIFTG